MEEKLILNFVNNFYRAPSFTEYKKMGGKHGNMMFYQALANLNLKTKRGRKATYQVFRGNRLIFEGSAKDIAEEFDSTAHNVSTLSRKGLMLKRKYKVIKKTV